MKNEYLLRNWETITICLFRDISSLPFSVKANSPKNVPRALLLLLTGYVKVIWLFCHLLLAPASNSIKITLHTCNALMFTLPEQRLYRSRNLWKDHLNFFSYQPTVPVHNSFLPLYRFGQFYFIETPFARSRSKIKFFLPRTSSEIRRHCTVGQK